MALAVDVVSFNFSWVSKSDLHYRFIRYEKKIEMISALKNFYDNINAMMPQEWRHANLEEFPSNSHFENIIREVPSEISDVRVVSTFVG